MFSLGCVFTPVVLCCFRSTDSNGLFMMQRTRRDNSSGFFPGYTVYEPAAQNCRRTHRSIVHLRCPNLIRVRLLTDFPATTIATLGSTGGDKGLAVSFISSHGVTSPTDGTLEVMMHRRFVDHGCRVDQGWQMDDQHRAVKTLRVRPTDKPSYFARGDSLHAHHPIAVYFAGDGLASEATAARGAAAVPDLPPNIHLHTFRTLDGADLRCTPFPPRECDPATATAAGQLELVVRLQHMYSAEDDPARLSKPATLNLKAWLSTWGDAQITETTL